MALGYLPDFINARLGRLALKDRVEPFIFVEKAKILTR
jgi:hypothetical protein